MAESFVAAYIQIVGEPQTGIWCDDCCLPARARFNLVAISEIGVSPWGTVERCLRCDGYEDGDEDD